MDEDCDIGNCFTLSDGDANGSITIWKEDGSGCLQFMCELSVS
jgi:hypothetical protein